MSKPVYVKYVVEGWIQIYPEHFKGISLSALAYEMTEGNGICTRMEDVIITTSHADLDGGAEGFFECEDEE